MNPRLTPRQVDVVLEILIVTAVASGVTSLAVGTSWTRLLTAIHAVAGLTLVVLAPAKMRGSVRTGLRRRRWSRWLSLGLAALVVATIGLGCVHSTGLWFGVGYGTALWTHVLVAFTLFAIFLWHVASRPMRPKLVDLDRRALLQGGGAIALGMAAYGAQEAVVRIGGLAGATRRFTGSHEIASFDPPGMPTVSWINDVAPPSTSPIDWQLDVMGELLRIDELAALARPVIATLDCTGGWCSKQSWDAVPLSSLIRADTAQSIAITSATGYKRLFPFTDRHNVYLATGYGGDPLTSWHGAPVRVIAPGRRGPWWIKWVTKVELDDRPWWLQLPFPVE